MKYSIFISSVRSEFSNERIKIKEYIENHEVFGKLFDVFVFEADVPSIGRTSEDIYLDKVRNSDIYIGILGQFYGNIRKSGFSATEDEYNEFYRIKGKTNAFFYLKNVDKREPEVDKFISKIKKQVTYTHFEDVQNLIEEINISLLHFLSNDDTSDFDSIVLLDSNLEDISSECYNYFLKKNGEPIQDSYINVLTDKLEVLNKNNDNYHLTTAGALFFTKNPNKFKQIDSKIKLARFKGKDKVDFIDNLTLEGPFLEVLHEMHSFFLRNIRKATKIIGFERYDFYEYPYEAIREAMVNALAHRDYTIKGVDISFYIFDDRIEIMSPGDLKAPLTTEMLNEDSGAIRSIRRNEKISELFHYAHEMEQYGTGIDRIKRSMKNHGLDDPVFNMVGNYLQVILYGPGENILDLPLSASINHISFDDLDLNDRQINLLTYLSNNYGITNKPYEEYFAVSRATVSRDIKVLLDNDLIKKHKQNNTVFYTL